MAITDFIKIIRQSEVLYPHGIFGQKNKLITCMNSTGYIYARKMPELYSQMDGIYVDGILMCKALFFTWGIRVSRRSFDMTSIAKDLFERLNNRNCNESIYFLGSKQNQVEASVAEFRKQYPNMNILGLRNGYINGDMERKEIINNIIELNPDYVVVGMGRPMQDNFAIDLRNAGYNGVVFTCGGFLHQSCNRLYYYPKWIDQFNLRWLYRVIKEGTWSRLFKDIFYFPGIFVFDRIKNLSIKIK